MFGIMNNIWRSYNNSNHGEKIRSICNPVGSVRVRVLVLEKRRRKEDTGGGDEQLAVENIGAIQKRQDMRSICSKPVASREIWFQDIEQKPHERLFFIIDTLLQILILICLFYMKNTKI